MYRYICDTLKRRELKVQSPKREHTYNNTRRKNMHKKYDALYINAFRKNIQAFKAAGCEYKDTDEFKTTMFYAIRYLNAIGKRYTSQRELEDLLDEYNAILGGMQLLTPLDLTRMFPVDKVYDGDKWQVKDYFYTMNELNKIGMDNLIGENLLPLMMDYMNEEIRRIIVRYMCLNSALLRFKGKDGIMEQWADSIGLDVYIKETDTESGNDYFISRKALKCLAAAAGAMEE